jgi:hypothetical protein
MFIRDLVAALDGCGVRYAIVGGVAVNLHGIPRMTYDIDIVVPMDEATLRSCHQAMLSLGLACRLPLRLEALADPALREEYETDRNLRAVTFTDPNDPLREVDVIVAPSRDPDGVAARATVVSAGGFTVRVAGIDDLIAMKRLAGRKQDEADIEHLSRIRKEPGRG